MIARTRGVIATAATAVGVVIGGTAVAVAQPALPSPQDLEGVLQNLVDPEVSDEVKSNLVVGGLQHHQANVLDRKLRHAEHRNGAPFAFTVSDIAEQGGPEMVSTQVTATGPGLAAPITKAATFSYVNGGWQLSQAAADELIEDVVGRLPG